MSKISLKVLLAAIGTFFLLTSPVWGDGPLDTSLLTGQGIIKLTDIQVQEFGRISQVTLKTTAPVDILDFKLANPPRVVVDMVGGNIYSLATERLLFERGAVKEIRSALFRKGPDDAYPGRKVDSVTVELRSDAKYRVDRREGGIVIEVETGEGLEAFLTPRPEPPPLSLFLQSLPNEKKSSEETMAGISKEIWQPDPKVIEPLPDISVLSLEECVQIGLANNGPLSLVKEETRLARARVIEAQRGLYPTASLKWAETRGEAGLTTADFTGREFALEAQQLIFDGGKAVALYKQAEVNYEVSQATHDRLLADTRYDVTQAYYQLARHKHAVGIYREIVEKTRADLERNRRRYDVGLNRRLDLLAVESQYQDLIHQTKAVERDLELARLALGQAMSLPPTEKVDIVADLAYEDIEVDLKSALHLALANRPEIEVGELLVQFNQYGKEVADSQDKFQMNLSGSLGKRSEVFEVEEKELQTEWFLGLSVSHPWGKNTVTSETILQDRAPAVGQFTSSKFQSHTFRVSLYDRLESGKVEASLRLEEAIEELERTRRVVTYETQQSYYDYLRALERVQTTALDVALADETERVVRAQTVLDEAKIQELFDVASRLLQVKSSHLEALATYHTSVAGMNRAIGIDGYFRSKEAKITERPLTKEVRHLLRGRDELWGVAFEEGKAEPGTAHVIYVSPKNDFVIINRGNNANVREGMVFTLMRDGKEMAEVKAIRIAEKAAACEIVATRTIHPVQVWDEVQPRRLYGVQRIAEETPRE